MQKIKIVDHEQLLYSEPDVAIDKIVDNKRYQYCRFSTQDNLYKEISSIAKRWRDGEISQRTAYELLEIAALPYERWLFDIIVDLAKDTIHLEYIAYDDEHRTVKAIAFLQHGSERSYNIQYK